MMKRALSLILCLLMLVPVLAGCKSEINGETNKGAYIYMYLTDQVYDLDPAIAYKNESALKVISLIFDNLFVLDENGKVKKSLAKDYEIYEDEKTGEYKMIITLNNTTWTDGINLSANDVVYSWKRLLDVANSYDAASLLFDIKNARLAKEGEASIDDVGIYALNENQLEIQFEGKIDYDQFLINLTSYALVPLREDVVKKTTDWAKKPATMVCSGPFRLRIASYEEGDESLILERNVYYYRDILEDRLDKSVTPYAILVDYSKTKEEIMTGWENGEIFYVGEIPMSVRADYKDIAEVTDALSTHTYFINENAVVRYYSEYGFGALETNVPVYDNTLVEGKDGDKIFAIKEVREALSLAIDRKAIADAVVFAKAAEGLVPYGVFNAKEADESFRAATESLLADSAKIDEAKSKLSAAGIDPANYMFALSVAGYDEVHVKIAEMVKASWESLGFHVAVNAVDVILNDDEYKYDKNVSEEDIYIPQDIRDDLFQENFAVGNYEVAAVDFNFFCADAFASLAQFAKNYTGGAAVVDNGLRFEIPAHVCGYNSEEFNAKIEAAFAEKDITKRAALLHEAEKILVEDAAVIPVVFNQNAVLVSELLSKYKFTFYGAPNFTKTKLKDYQDYFPETEL